jgi:hypothetical protein
VAKIDGIYNMIKTFMSRYTLLVQCGYGLGQPVGFLFVQLEDAETILNTRGKVQRVLLIFIN